MTDTWKQHAAKFKPGFRFSVQQASLTKKPRKYTIVFELDDKWRPLRVGGVKPRPDTLEHVSRIVGATVSSPAKHLAQLIADELVTQGNEIDNLGDNESVVLLGKSPCINLVQLAERIIADRGGRHDAGRS